MRVRTIRPTVGPRRRRGEARKLLWATTGVAITAGLFGAGAAPASADPTPPSDKWNVKANLLLASKTEGYKTVPLRLGYYNDRLNRGFGWRKIYSKHNITNLAAIRYVTRSPNRGKLGAKRWLMTAYARKWHCSAGRCSLNAIIRVEQVIYFGPIDGNPKPGPFGVNTQYCVGYNPKCPNWVTKALSAADTKASAGAQDQPASQDPDTTEVPDNTESSDSLESPDNSQTPDTPRSSDTYDPPADSQTPPDDEAPEEETTEQEGLVYDATYDPAG